MKKRLTQILALSVLVVLCLSTAALATARRASLYLDDYYVNSAALSGGRVVIEFDVDATKTVSQVGAGCIVLQEKNSSGSICCVFLSLLYSGCMIQPRLFHRQSILT